MTKLWIGISFVVLLVIVGLAMYWRGTTVTNRLNQRTDQTTPAAEPTASQQLTQQGAQYFNSSTDLKAYCGTVRSHDVEDCVRQEECGRQTDECEAQCVQNNATKECVDQCKATYVACAGTT